MENAKIKFGLDVARITVHKEFEIKNKLSKGERK